jgi:transposase-like protein
LRGEEELLAERGIEVDHVTVYRWVQRFTTVFLATARPCRHATGDRWFVDETSVKSRAGESTCWRGSTSLARSSTSLSHRGGIWQPSLSSIFNQAPQQVLRPTEVITDRAPAYLRVLDERLPNALHVVEQYANIR